MAASLEKNYRIIEDHERQFAYMLASRVIQKPTLSVWMILIPIIFLHFFYRMNRFKTGREEFCEHYMVSRMRALDTAMASLKNREAPDIEAVAAKAQIPPETMKEYRELMRVMVGHYRDLLAASGDTFHQLIRSAYGTKTNYLLFLNRLNQVEKEMNASLKPHMEQTTEGFNETVKRIESRSEKLRRENADSVFDGNAGA